MTRNDRVYDLLLRWEERRARGQPLTPEELCHDCPELLPEVRECLRQRAGGSYASEGSGEALTPPPPTTVLLSQPDDLGAAAAAAGPRYRRLHFHARGGLGEVYVGFDQELRREVALKRMQRPLAVFPEAQRRFLREAEVTGKLEHPGIVPVYGLIRDDDGMPCYAMRFIQGESLQDAIQRFHEGDQRPRDPGERSLAFRELLTRFAAVCKTLAYAHSRGILHRDVKPANVMLGKYGETLVVDWGLARPVERTETDRESGEETLRPSPESGAGETRIGQTVGTPVYMSPEQAAGRWDVVGPASDIYSLGATLYALLTGRDPFTGSNHAEVLQKVQQGDFPPPRRVKPATPAGLEAVCLKAMARKPEERYASALELAEEVEHWLADEPVRAYREPWAARARRWRRRHKALVAGLTALVLTALVVGGGGGYRLQRQAAERRADAERHRLGAEQSLEKVPGLLKQWRWPEAQTLLDEAESRLGETAPAGLRDRIMRARADLKLATKLDTVRLERAGRIEAPDRGWKRAAQDYAAVFAEAGLAAAESDEEAAAAWVGDSAIRDQLVAALDEWAMLSPDTPVRRWLLGVVRRVDPDGWRDRIRDPKIWQDRAALEVLANELLQDEAKLKAQSPTLLAWLGTALSAQRGNALALMNEACRLRPGDFWLHFELGNALFKAKQWEAAAGYFRAARALRPETPAVYHNLGIAVVHLGQGEEAVKECRTALGLNPKYAEPHIGLGYVLQARGQYDEAIREFRAAADLDPKNFTAHYNLASVLHTKGQLEEAHREYRTAIDLDPKVAEAHDGLAGVLFAKRQMDEAIREVRTALELDPKYPKSHYNLGNVLRLQGHLDEAIKEYRIAIELDPQYANAHYNLGKLLKGKGRLDEAIAAYRSAAQYNPMLAEAHCNLGQGLKEQGKFAEALVALKKGHELGSQRPDWPYPSAQWVRECEQMVALEKKLPALLGGRAKPADDAERLALARLCQEPFMKLYASSAHFYAEAFANDAKLADDMRQQNRYNAACAATLAGCGRGEDADQSDEKERARLRQQALDWLRADLALWSNQAESSDPKVRGTVQQTLKHWPTDADLTGVRDPAGLAKLPAEEQQAWRKFWDEVAAVLRRAGESR